VGNPEALLDGLLWVDSAVERPLNGDFAVGPLLAGSCRWRSSLADIPASVCFRDQRQAVVDPLQTVSDSVLAVPVAAICRPDYLEPEYRRGLGDFMAHFLPRWRDAAGVKSAGKSHAEVIWHVSAIQRRA
jgi:hypothetical protein